MILATNAWTVELLPSIPITPVRAQMLASAPAPPLIPCPVYAHWGHRYWRQLEDGSVLVGGFRDRAAAEEVGYGLGTTALVQGHLDNQLRALGAAAEVTHRWSGTMGFSADGLPLVGRPPGLRRIHVCAGYTGHGMGLAVSAAEALTRHVLDDDAVPGWLSADRLAVA